MRHLILATLSACALGVFAPASAAEPTRGVTDTEIVIGTRVVSLSLKPLRSRDTSGGVMHLAQMPRVAHSLDRPARYARHATRLAGSS